MDGIGAIFSAFGLSTAAGLNAYIPLLAIGLVDRYTNLITLKAPFDILSNPLVLLALAVLVLLDMIGDKIPVVDHALHTAGMVISPISGAILFLAANSNGGMVDPVLAAVIGLVAAGLTHTSRAAIRPLSTVTTGGLATPVISAAEDAGSIALTGLAIFAPVIAFFVAITGLVTVVMLARRVFRRKERPTP